MAEQVHDASIHGGERILVIDDDPGLAEVVQLMLAREGYAVEREGTLEGGLRRVGAADFDLVVTDLKLPDGTGLDAIPAIRGLHEGLPIILMTSYSSMESAIAALRAGAVDYITKPFQNDEFVHAVERALRARRDTEASATAALAAARSSSKRFGRRRTPTSTRTRSARPTPPRR